ncbi:MAG: tyrosine--tRNA ligase [Rickettsiales bacterium]|jgi:tyrosyl-tRNA synthetase|nr:tyrosine--tRNA ligase [Rickettsiales bacterium]
MTNREEKSKKIDEILDRGIIREILPTREKFKEKLMNEKLKFYIGADPTNSSLHLSHAKNFMLLEEFRRLGHEVYILFGDFTATIGDPSDRTSARARLTREDVMEFSKDWVKQIERLVDFKDESNPAKVVYNSEWLGKLSMVELINLMSNTTVQRMLERDMFQKRIVENKPIHLHEFIYPIFQGYDSVALDVDVELCGTDQTFNALMGRTLVERYKKKEKFVVCVNLMENPVTGELMSKSRGTGVFLNVDANTMFGQIMAQPDEMIEILLINDTRISKEKIKELDINNKPMEAKIFTAFEIVKIFFGKEQALKVKDNFVNTFSKKNFPTDAPVFNLNFNEEISLVDLIDKNFGDELSKSEIRRLIKQNSITINDKKIDNINYLISSKTGNELQLKIGKRKFLLVKIRN